jgi:uncharacterized protein DUF3606
MLAVRTGLLAVRSAPAAQAAGAGVRNVQVDRRMNHALLVTERQFAAQDGYTRQTAVGKSAQEAGVRDTAAVDVRNWHSMQYWAKWLGISEQQLIRATRVAGTNVALIEQHLAERRARRQRKRTAAVTA